MRHAVSADGLGVWSGPRRRMYAQALTLSALLAWAGVEYLDRDVTAAKAAVVDTASYAHQQKLKREASSS